MIILPAPHSRVQEEIILDPASSVNLCGRQFGKTEAGAERITRFGLLEPGLYWWVGYDWSSASMRRAWSLLCNYTRKIYKAMGKSEDYAGDCIKESKKILIWPRDTEIWLRTAEHPESLTGEAINGVVCDEFTLWRPNVWDEFLEACTLVKKGWACFIGIPKGDGNWGCQMYESVISGARRGWIARKAKTADNPLVDPEWLANIRRTTATWLYQQEYEAAIISGVGSAFPPAIVEASIASGVFERAADPTKEYFAYVDPSGGGADEYALAVAHIEPVGNRIVQDYLAAEVAKNPDQTTERYAAALKKFKIHMVIGDAYAGEWPREQFRKYGIDYRVSDLTASETYIEFQPLMREGRIQLLDDSATKEQFVSLLHKKSISGRDTIVHPPQGHDDRANVTAGACLTAYRYATLETSGKHDHGVALLDDIRLTELTEKSKMPTQAELDKRRDAYLKQFDF